MWVELAQNHSSGDSSSGYYKFRILLFEIWFNWKSLLRISEIKQYFNYIFRVQETSSESIYRFCILWLYLSQDKPFHIRVHSSAFTLVFFSAYSTLKMEALFSSETSVNFQRIIRPYIPEDSTLYNHCCENLKSYVSHKFCNTSMRKLRTLYEYTCIWVTPSHRR
jgi:hypothetical protein